MNATRQTAMKERSLSAFVIGLPVLCEEIRQQMDFIWRDEVYFLAVPKVHAYRDNVSSPNSWIIRTISAFQLHI